MGGGGPEPPGIEYESPTMPLAGSVFWPCRVTGRSVREKTKTSMPGMAPLPPCALAGANLTPFLCYLCDLWRR